MNPIAYKHKDTNIILSISIFIVGIVLCIFFMFGLIEDAYGNQNPSIEVFIYLLIPIFFMIIPLLFFIRKFFNSYKQPEILLSYDINGFILHQLNHDIIIPFTTIEKIIHHHYYSGIGELSYGKLEIITNKESHKIINVRAIDEVMYYALEIWKQNQNVSNF